MSKTLILCILPANERRRYTVAVSHWLDAYTEWFLDWIPVDICPTVTHIINQLYTPSNGQWHKSDWKWDDKVKPIPTFPWRRPITNKWRRRYQGQGQGITTSHSICGIQLFVPVGDFRRNRAHYDVTVVGTGTVSCSGACEQVSKKHWQYRQLFPEKFA